MPACDGGQRTPIPGKGVLRPLWHIGQNLPRGHPNLRVARIWVENAPELAPGVTGLIRMAVLLTAVCGRCGYSPIGGEEVLAAEHGAPEHVAEGRSLLFRERVYEHRNTDLCGPARLRDFAGFGRAEQCPPRERLSHFGRTTVRDTPPLDVPAHHAPTMRLH